MKKALNAWSVPGNVPFPELFAQLSAAGFDGVELNLDAPDSSAHSLTLQTTPEELRTIKELSRQYHLPVHSVSSSLYGPDTLGADAPEDREKARDILRRQLELAQGLGAEAILVVPGGIGPERTIRRAWENSLESLAPLRQEIAGSDVRVGLENVWNNFFASPRDMVSFIDQLDCPAIQAYFDVGNVVIFSYPESWIDLLDNRIVKVHVKDFCRSGWNAGYFCNLLEGSVDWKKVMAALRKAGYDGYLTAELGALPDSPEFLYKTTSMALDHILTY